MRIASLFRGSFVSPAAGNTNLREHQNGVLSFSEEEVKKKKGVKRKWKRIGGARRQ